MSAPTSRAGCFLFSHYCAIAGTGSCLVHTPCKLHVHLIVPSAGQSLHQPTPDCIPLAAPSIPCWRLNFSSRPFAHAPIPSARLPVPPRPIEASFVTLKSCRPHSSAYGVGGSRGSANPGPPCAACAPRHARHQPRRGAARGAQRRGPASARGSCPAAAADAARAAQAGRRGGFAAPLVGGDREQPLDRREGAGVQRVHAQPRVGLLRRRCAGRVRLGLALLREGTGPFGRARRSRLAADPRAMRHSQRRAQRGLYARGHAAGR
jgi:hypothetical protein